MPSRSEHVRCARALLGKSNPEVHRLMDHPSVKYGSMHRPVTHTAVFLEDVERRFGYEGKREAVVHMLQDWGFIGRRDYVLESRGCD